VLCLKYSSKQCIIKICNMHALSLENIAILRDGCLEIAVGFCVGSDIEEFSEESTFGGGVQSAARSLPVCCFEHHLWSVTTRGIFLAFGRHVRRTEFV
jgi:Ca2+/Na+ antiporter